MYKATVEAQLCYCIDIFLFKRRMEQQIRINFFIYLLIYTVSTVLDMHQRTVNLD
jgi:hypothetical protein